MNQKSCLFSNRRRSIILNIEGHAIVVTHTRFGEYVSTPLQERLVVAEPSLRNTKCCLNEYFLIFSPFSPV